MLTVAALTLSHNAELSTTNVRSGAAFDNLKASWNQALKLGDFNTNMRADYDYNANRDFLNEVSFNGDLVESSSADDMRVSYEVTHNFGAKNTNVKLTANTQGTTLGAEYDQADGLKEVSAQRDVNLGDNKVNVQPSWLVKAQTARVKLMSRLGDGNKDSVSAQVDYATQGGATTYEVGYDRNLDDGRDISATFNPDSKNLNIDYVDNTFEKGATWTASADVPLENGGSNNILDAAKLTLKRSWQW
jgi:hypothetical protein